MRNFVVECSTTHVLTPAAEVTASVKAAAASDWPIWDSSEDFRGTKTPKFTLRYRKEERVLILEGKAELTPQNGDAPFTVQEGDWVVFHAGFVADWVVSARMRKHYCYFESDGEACAEPSKATPVIACDVDGCGKECVEEHFQLCDEDICPKCVKFARGSDKRRFATAIRCVRGVPAVEATSSTTDKKRRPVAASGRSGKAKKT